MAEYMDSYINEAEMTSKADTLSSFDWELECTSLPKAIYFPGKLVVMGRTNSVSVPADFSVSNGDAAMRGWSSKQVGMSNNSGQLVLNFQDFEDQAVTAFCLDYYYKSNNPLTRRSLRKEDLASDWVFRHLNVNRQPVRTCYMKTCLYSNSDPGETADNQKNPIQSGSLTLDVQLFYWVLNN